MPNRIAQFVGLTPFLIAIALVPTASAAEANVVRDGQRLSMSFRDTALNVVLQQLQRDGKITVQIPPSLLGRTVTVKFQNLEIDPALETLFKSASLRNFAIVHEPGARGRVTVVLIEDGETSGTPPTPASQDRADQTVPVAASEIPNDAAVTQSDPLIGARWGSSPASGADSSAQPQTIKQLPQFATEEASGPSGTQAMAVPASAVPPAMANLPAEKGPSYPGGPEGVPITPQMRRVMGFPRAAGHY